MASLVSTIYLYLSALKGLYNPVTNTVIFDIPEDAFRCDNNQFLKMTLAQFTCTNTLQNVPAGSQLVLSSSSFGTESYPIHNGVYTIQEIVQFVNSIQTRVTLEYEKHTNRMMWEAVDTNLPNIAIAVHGGVSYLFGQRPQDAVLPLAVAAGKTPSTYSVIPQYITDLCVHVSGILPGPPQNVGNIGVAGATLNTSTVMGVIPMRAAPNRVNVYQNVADTFQMQIYDSDIQRFEIRLTDVLGNPVYDIADWNAVLKVDTYARPRQDSVVQTLQGISEMIRIFVTKLAIEEV